MGQAIRIRSVSEASERVAIANLLYRDDKPFVPITPLAVLRESTSFYQAVFPGVAGIRAASSFEEWLRGSDTEGAAETTTVYELASSIVREPAGGFEDPSLQHVFAFVRLVVILYPYLELRREDQGESISVIAAIAAANVSSLTGLRRIGMVPVDPLPQWLEYEHRNWFPKADGTAPRRIGDEAHYLWFPAAAVEAFFRKLAPYADGREALSRKARRDPATREAYRVEIDVTEYRDIVGQYGSFTNALDHLPFGVFREPPRLARLNGGYF